MTLRYKILGQIFYQPEINEIPGTPGGGGIDGYGYYGAGGGDIGGQGSSGSYVEILEPQILYTVPENTETIITSLYVTNHDSVERTYDIAIVPASETLSLKHHIRWDIPVKGFDFDSNDVKITMSEGDRIYVFPSTINKIGFTAFGVEKI